MTQRTGHAIVVGASIAGMLAAKMLSKHFERVTVLERDPAPEGPQHRRGVAHGRHVHALLGGGQLVMESMFPGIERDLVEAGAVPFRPSLDVIAVDGYGTWPRRDLGLTNFAQSRALLEHVVRTRLAETRDVEVRWDCRVEGVVTDTHRARLTGVRCRSGDARHELAADLVVDAAGARGRSVEWLRELGYAQPAETRIEVDLAYATAVFAIPDRAQLDAKNLGIGAAAPDKRSALLLEIEGGRWIVGLAGRLGVYPPTDLAGYRAYASSLPVKQLGELIGGLTPLEPIVGFRYPASVRRRFEKLSEFPEGLLVIGDALCSFNPIYGQGMTSAAMQVQALDGLFGRSVGEAQPIDGLWRQYFPVAAEIVATPWQQAGSVDLQYSETIGARPAHFEDSVRFGRALARLAFEDTGVHKLLIEVAQLITPRSAFSDPALVQRVTAVMSRE